MLNDPALMKFISLFDEINKEGQLNNLITDFLKIMKTFIKTSPELKDDTVAVLKEATIVLKAIQKTWLLRDESEEVLKEMTEAGKTKKK